jgi:hypothetical protein
LRNQVLLLDGQLPGELLLDQIGLALLLPQQRGVLTPEPARFANALALELFEPTGFGFRAHTFLFAPMCFSRAACSQLSFEGKAKLVKLPVGPLGPLPLMRALISAKLIP